MAAKPDEPPPHPPKDQLPNVSYCITSPPPWPEAILLGFQHYVVMLGTTVMIPSMLVPQMGGGIEEKAKVIQTLLFVAGLNTFLQTWFGTRLPVVIGGSYTFIAPTISIIMSSRWSDPDPIMKFRKTMRAIQGAFIVASSIQIVIGFSGLWRNIAKYFSPIGVVPLVLLTGFGMYEFGFPGVGRCVEIGLPVIVLLIFLNQYLVNMIKPGKNVYERFAVLITVAIVWTYAFVLTVGGAYNGKPLKTQMSCRTDRVGLIDAAPWISIPYPFQWGPPSFDAGEAFVMMMAAFVTLIESTGAMVGCSRLASATPLPPSILSRGIGWQGIAILLSGLFGTTNGSSVLVENVGLIGLTHVGSRRVVQISAGFMIFFSVLGKFGAVFASIPAPIYAARSLQDWPDRGTNKGFEDHTSKINFTSTMYYVIRSIAFTSILLFLGAAVMAAGNENGVGPPSVKRIGSGSDGCSENNIMINQNPSDRLPSGIPTYEVFIENLCMALSGVCNISNIHLRCGWFASARLIPPEIFRRVAYDDCLVNDGKPFNAGQVVIFQYANTYKYPMSILSVSCN